MNTAQSVSNVEDILISKKENKEQLTKEDSPSKTAHNEWYVKLAAEIYEMVEYYLGWETNNLSFRESQFVRHLIWKFQDYSIYIHREIRHKNFFPIRFVSMCALPFIINEGLDKLVVSDKRVLLLADALLHVLSNEVDYGKYNSLDGNILYLRDIFSDIRNMNA